MMITIRDVQVSLIIVKFEIANRTIIKTLNIGRPQVWTYS